MDAITVPNGHESHATTETIPQQLRGARRFGSRPPAAGSGAVTATLERPPAPRTAPPSEPAAPDPGPRTREFGLARPHRAGFPWGGTLALMGSLAVIISAILDWGGPFRATLPRDISATWLLEPSGLVSGPSLGIVMLLAGTLGALFSLVGMAAPRLTFVRRIVGLLTLMIPMAFAFRTLQLTEGSAVSDLTSVLGPGAILAAAGALVAFAAGRPPRA